MQNMGNFNQEMQTMKWIVVDIWNQNQCNLNKPSNTSLISSQFDIDKIS